MKAKTVKNAIAYSALSLAIASMPLHAETTGVEKIKDIKGPGGYNITGFDRESKTGFGGYFDTEIISAENGDDGRTLNFRNHRMVIEASARLNPKILFNTELEFEYGGNPDAHGEIKIEQAWVDFEINEAFVQRTGIVVVPFGRQNILHDSDVRDLTGKGAYSKYIVPSTWFDTGVGAHGLFTLGNWEMHYEAYLVNGLGTYNKEDGTERKASNSKGIRDMRANYNMKKDNNDDKAFVGRLGGSPMLGLELGTSFYTGKYDDDNTKSMNMFGLDALWKEGAYEVLGEWAQINLDADGNGGPEKMNGYFVEGRYHVTGDWLKNSVIGQGFDNPVVTLIARYSAVDTNTDVEDKYDISQTTLGVNYRPLANLVYKLEYEMNSEKKDEHKNDQIVASVALGF